MRDARSLGQNMLERDVWGAKQAAAPQNARQQESGLYELVLRCAGCASAVGKENRAPSTDSKLRGTNVVIGKLEAERGTWSPEQMRLGHDKHQSAGSVQRHPQMIKRMQARALCDCYSSWSSRTVAQAVVHGSRFISRPW